MAENNILPGALISSSAGHDKGKLFLVLRTDDKFVYYADGKTRKLEKPKQKKRKHIEIFGHFEEALFEAVKSGKLSNKRLKKCLNKYLSEFEKPINREGNHGER